MFFKKGTLPFKCSGFPVKPQRLSKLNCKVLVERITAELEPGLLRSYHMQWMFKIFTLLSLVWYHTGDKSLCCLRMRLTQLTSCVRSFLWSSDVSHRKQVLVVWNTLCLPMKQCGTGTKGCIKWNIAKVTKLVWHIATKADCLWITCVNHYYLKDKTIWQCKL